MTDGVTVWFVLYGASTLLFFGIAAVVAVRGLSELRDLLGRTSRGGNERDAR